MEKLQSMLRSYNNSHINQYLYAPWGKIYCESSFPKYWQLVYSILEHYPRSNSIIEIGTGLGDILSIACYLKFKSILGIERDLNLAKLAQNKIKTLFELNDVVQILDYPNSTNWDADILIMVNCVYSDGINSKKEYLNKVRGYYNSANKPRVFIFESISSDYIACDTVFPDYIRLDKNDILETFSDCNIQCFETYRFPKNQRSKTLFLIEKENSHYENINCFI